MGKAQAAQHASIDVLLASIRQAITDEVDAPPARAIPDAAGTRRLAPADPDTGPRSAARTLPPATPGDRGRLTAIAPLLRPDAARPAAARPAAAKGEGDARLEEALARLSQAGRVGGKSAEPDTRPLHTNGSASALRLRPAIETVAEVDAAPGEPGPAPPDPPRLVQAARPAALAPLGPRLATALPARAPEPARIEAKPANDLLSPLPSASASAAFDRLTQALATRATPSDRAVEEMTRDLLMPMLRDWLDANLPAIVEQLVREEIQRVARRGAR